MVRIAVHYPLYIYIYFYICNINYMLSWYSCYYLKLLKFVPTPEEKQMLNEHQREVEQMARADHFLFKMIRSVILWLNLKNQILFNEEA